MKKVIEIVNTDDVAFVYYKEKDLRQFKNNSNCDKTEYQCHYDALMMTFIFDDGSKAYHIFPLVYYNYPQKVSSASVDFDMKDVAKTSEYVDSLTMKLYSELRSKLGKIKYNNEVKFTLTRFNNIHKHP